MESGLAQRYEADVDRKGKERRMKTDLGRRSIPLCVLRVTAVSISLVGALAGCKPPQAPATPKPVAQAAPFTPEGRWHSQMGKDMMVHLLPDGTLQMIDPRRQPHLFHRVGP